MTDERIKDEVTEIMRLASLMATARVRRYAALRNNVMAVSATEQGVINATENLRLYVERTLRDRSNVQL